MNTCIYNFICICMHTNMYTYLYIYICIFINTYIYVHIYAYVYTYVFIFVGMYIYIYISKVSLKTQLAFRCTAYYYSSYTFDLWHYTFDLWNFPTGEWGVNPVLSLFSSEMCFTVIWYRAFVIELTSQSLCHGDGAPTHCCPEIFKGQPFSHFA